MDQNEKAFQKQACAGLLDAVTGIGFLQFRVLGTWCCLKLPRTEPRPNFLESSNTERRLDAVRVLS